MMRGTPEGDRLNVPVTLVEAWEAEDCFAADAGSRL